MNRNNLRELSLKERYFRHQFIIEFKDVIAFLCVYGRKGDLSLLIPLVGLIIIKKMFSIKIRNLNSVFTKR